MQDERRVVTAIYYNSPPSPLSQLRVCVDAFPWMPSLNHYPLCSRTCVFLPPLPTVHTFLCVSFQVAREQRRLWFVCVHRVRRPPTACTSGASNQAITVECCCSSPLGVCCTSPELCTFRMKIIVTSCDVRYGGVSFLYDCLRLVCRWLTVCFSE